MADEYMAILDPSCNGKGGELAAAAVTSPGQGHVERSDTPVQACAVSAQAHTSFASASSEHSCGKQKEGGLSAWLLKPSMNSCLPAFPGSVADKGTDKK